MSLDIEEASATTVGGQSELDLLADLTVTDPPPPPVNRAGRRHSHPGGVAGLTARQQALIRRHFGKRRRAVEKACVSFGLRSSLALALTLVDYEEITELYRPGSRPNPAQTTLARRCGWAGDDQVREHLRRLEAHGIIRRWVPRPSRLSDGTWTRATTRYLVCDRIAAGAKACPLPRRQLSRRSLSPTPSFLGVTSTSLGEVADGAVDPSSATSTASCETSLSTRIEPPAADSAVLVAAAPPVAGVIPVPWAAHPGGRVGWLADCIE